MNVSKYFKMVSTFFLFCFLQHYLILKKIICRNEKSLSFKILANSETLEEKELAIVSLKARQDQSCAFLQQLCK